MLQMDFAPVARKDQVLTIPPVLSAILPASPTEALPAWPVAPLASPAAKPTDFAYLATQDLPPQT